MSAAQNLLVQLEAVGGRLQLVGDKVRVVAPGPLPSALVEELRHAKAELFTLLNSPIVYPLGKPVEIAEASANHDGGVVGSHQNDGDATQRPLKWDEAYARVMAMPLPKRPPSDRFNRFREDMRRFFSVSDVGSWAATSAGLGLSLHQIIGCDYDRPEEFASRQGLIWRLDGRDIVAMTDRCVCVVGEGLTTRPAATTDPSAHTARHWLAVPQPDASAVLPWELALSAA